MISFNGKPCYLACGATDMRKSINGFAAIVEGSFKLDPFDEVLFVFCNVSVKPDGTLTADSRKGPDLKNHKSGQKFSF